jgi:XapX domain-containing protein
MSKWFNMSGMRSSPARAEVEPVKMYLLSLGAGILVGIVYSLLNVRSPAPPLVALVGLLGILLGEQAIPVAKRMLAGSVLSVAWREAHCTKHVFGALPGRHTAGPLDATDLEETCR